MSVARTTLSVMTIREGQRVHPTAATRRAARQARVAAGMEDLDRWLRDQVRTGLAGLQRAGYGHFDQVAARMVDAQAPGVAGTLRSIPAQLVHDDWPQRVLESLAGLRLLVKAHRQLDLLPADLAATVRSRVGYPVGKEEVLAGPGIADHWTALGSVDTVEYRLATRRVWLWGRRTRRWALWLAFAPPGQAMDATVAAGKAYEAEMHFYPGSGQMRALPGGQRAADGLDPPPAADLAETSRRFADLLAADPWADRMPVVLAGVPVQPRQPGQSWRFRDAAGRGCDLIGLSGDPWPLVAFATAGPILLFGEWSSAGMRPISVLPDSQGCPFTTQLTR